MREYYNEPVKNRYLDTITSEATRYMVSLIFKESKGTEETLGYDLYNFQEEYIAEVLKNMDFKAASTARTNFNFIYNYISWCIKNGYRRSNLHPLDACGSKWADQFVDRKLKIHWSEEELTDLIESFDNAQDQAMIRLWFEGIVGRDFNEIKNLHYYDIDWNNNELELKDSDGTKRKVKVSDKCMRYLKNAYQQETYIFSTEKELPLFRDDYIFRNTVSRRTKEVSVSTSVIYTRLNGLKEIHDLEHLTPNGIKQSGMIWQAVEIYNRDGQFGEKSQFYEIGDRYKTPKASAQGYDYYNITLLKEFVNKEKFKELYDIDIEF